MFYSSLTSFIFEFKKILSFQLLSFSIAGFNLNRIFDSNYINLLIFKHVFLLFFILKLTIKRNELMSF